MGVNEPIRPIYIPYPPKPPDPPDPPDALASQVQINNATHVHGTNVTPAYKVTPLLHIPTLVNQWTPATALLDSGASCNFINSQFVTQHQLPRYEIEPITVNLAIDKSTCTNEITTIEITLPCGFTFHLTAVIVPNLTNDIILGINFLKVFNPIIDWKHGTITIDRNLLLHSTTITKATEQSTPVLLQSYTIDPTSNATMNQPRHPQRKQRKLLQTQKTKQSKATLVNMTPEHQHNNEQQLKHCEQLATDMFETYKDVFAPIPPGLPPDRPNFVYKIETLPNITPPAKAPYRLSTLHNDELKKQLDQLLANGWIRSSRSPYAAPVLFAPKKDSGWRMCIDYRDLNSVTIKNKHPLPNISDLLDRLGAARWFSKLDLASGYHQVRIHPDDISKTAFTTRYGMYEWFVVPFGLCNAPGFFMQLMQHILAKGLDNFVIVFLDDILVFSKTLPDHIQHVHEVLQTLRANKLYAKQSKCSLFKQRIDFLGYVISGNGIEMESNKVQQILNWPQPQSVKHVRQFLGLAGFYRSFIKNFSGIAAPLSDLMKTTNSRVFTWTEECTKSFNALKQIISSEPVLMLPREHEPFTIHTDASQFAIGAVLMQYNEQGQLKPIAFTSRKLHDAECKYPTHDQELLSIIHALKQWKHYCLNGTKTTIVTDHHSLKYFNTQRHLGARQIRWMEFLQQFDLNITYKPGTTNIVADALSRRPDYESFTSSEHNIESKNDNNYTTMFTNLNNLNTITPTPAPTVSVTTTTDSNKIKTSLLELIKQAYIQDAAVQQLMMDINTPLATSATNIQHKDSQYTIRDGLLLYNNRIVIPNENTLKTTIISQHHDSITSSHPGSTKTIELISRLFYWKNMHQDIKQYVASCLPCQSNKFSTKSPQGLLHPIETPDTRWHTITTDFITKLPVTTNGHDAIAVFVDKYSKMVHYVPTYTNINASQFCDLFINNIVRLHGLPNCIISDRDVRFTSSFWNAVCKQLQIKLSMSSAYHPMTDGQTERANRTLEEALRTYVNYKQTDWDQHLALIEFAHNNVIHSSTGYSPFFLNSGQHPRTPIHAQLGNECTINETAATTILNLYDTLDSALTNIEKSQIKQAKYANEHRRDFEQFNVGDLVLLSTTNLRSTGPGRAAKLSPQRIGPFRITRVLSKLNYELDLPEIMNKKYNIFHVSLLTKYNENDINKYATRPSLLTRPPPEILDDEEVYEVQEILKHRGTGNKRQYLVHWKGYELHESTWEPKSSFKRHQDIIKQYEKSVTSDRNK